MAITYNKTAERIEKWGTDITVEFFDDGKHIRTKTFRKIKDFEGQMARAISNIQDDLDRVVEPTSEEKMAEIEKHFETNISMTKEDYLKVELTGKIVVEVSK